MVFVERFPVQNRFYGLKAIIMGYVFVGALISAMSGLVHVKIQPCILLKPCRRPAPVLWLGMKAHQSILVDPYALYDTFGHLPPYLDIIRIFTGISIPSHDPYYVVVILISIPDPFSVGFGIFQIENYRAQAPIVFKYLIAPSW